MHKCLILTGNEVHHNFLANSLIKNCKNFNFTIIKTNSGKNNFEFFYPFLSRGIKNKNKEKILDYLFLRNKTLCMNENFNLLISPKNEVILKDSKHLHNYLEKFLKNKTFDIVITYGSPIIKNKKILNLKSFNIHFGLSRFFRGGTSNITALASNNFDKVGVTCHELKPLIDSGNVLFEIRKIPISKLKVLMN